MHNGRIGHIQLFFSLFRQVRANFPAIYKQEVEEDEEPDEGREAEDRGNNSSNATDWGLLGVVLAVCEKTLTPIEEVYRQPIVHTLYVASYIVEQNHRLEMELKKSKRK